MEGLNIEEMFKNFAGYVALGVEIIAIALIAIGAIEAVIGLMRPRYDPLRPFAWKKEVFIRLGSWLLLGLEFALAADIVRTAISPTWAQLGQLATIAAIRTVLNYFLERDVEKFVEKGRVEEEEVKAGRAVEARTQLR
jgi:uncharacterized membrane protein